MNKRGGVLECVLIMMIHKNCHKKVTHFVNDFAATGEWVTRRSKPQLKNFITTNPMDTLMLK